MADPTQNHFKKRVNYSDKELTLPVGTLNFLNGTTQSTEGGGGGGTAEFLTLAVDAGLTMERVLTPGTGLSGVDAGAGSTYTLNLADTAVTPAAYTSANITVDQQGRITAATDGGGTDTFQDEGMFLKSTQPTPQSIVDSTWTVILWGAAHNNQFENFPNPNFIANQYLPPINGFYDLLFSCDFDANATGIRQVRIIDVNVAAELVRKTLPNPSATLDSQVIVIARHIELTTADELQFQVRHTRGANLDVNIDSRLVYLGVSFNGPL